MTSSVIDVTNPSKQNDAQESPEASVVDESSTQSDVSAAVEPRKLPGFQLKEARQNEGLSVSEVAKKLYMSVRKLEALERDDYHDLPSEVFVQGYIKKYSVIVNQNAEQLLADYEHYLKTQRALNPVAGQLTLGVEKRSRFAFLSLKRLVPTGLFVLSISVLVLVMTFTKQERPAMLSKINEAEQIPESPVSQLDSTTLDEMASELSAIRNQNEAANILGSDTSGLVAKHNQASSPESEALVGALPVKINGLLNVPVRSATSESNSGNAIAANRVSANSAPAGPFDRLIFNVSENCWIEVSDVNGSKIFSRLANAGQTIALDGNAPFSIMLGNARGVEISINGKSVVVNTLPGRDTARLVVGK